jgi:hypothetical protein
MSVYEYNQHDPWLDARETWLAGFLFLLPISLIQPPAQREASNNSFLRIEQQAKLMVKVSLGFS